MTALFKLYTFITQTFWIPTPTLTESNLHSLAGRVIIVTGGNAGVGFELAKILYQNNATVYIAGRSPSKCLDAISSIQSSYPSSSGRLEHLTLDLTDLRSVKKAAENFMKKESRLDVLVNNAGVLGDREIGKKTPQGHDLTIGTNCLGPFLLTKLLTPMLEKTAKVAEKGSVRVLFAGSMGIDLRSPMNGIQFDKAGEPVMSGANTYPESKTGSYFFAKEFARRFPLAGEDGVMSLSFNPGNLRSNLFGAEGQQSLGYRLLFPLLFHPPVYGAYTELFAGFSQDIKAEMNGAYVIPWGRIAAPRSDVVAGTKSVEEGGTGAAEKFWEWCDRETKSWC